MFGGVSFVFNHSCRALNQNDVRCVLLPVHCTHPLRDEKPAKRKFPTLTHYPCTLELRKRIGWFLTRILPGRLNVRKAVPLSTNFRVPLGFLFCTSTYVFKQKPAPRAKSRRIANRSPRHILNPPFKKRPSSTLHAFKPAATANVL